MKIKIAILAFLIVMSPSVFADGSKIKGFYIGYRIDKLSYQLESDGSGSHPNASASVNRFIFGKHLNHWAALEFGALYSSSVDKLQGASLGRSLEMEVNSYYSLDFLGSVYNKDKIDVHGVIGLSKMRYLDSDNDSASGLGLNLGIGASYQFTRAIGFKLGWELLPTIKYDDNLFGAPLDPVSVKASSLILQVTVGIK